MPPACNLYDNNALRLLESRATAALGGDAFELMRRAGQASWRYLLQHWPAASRIVVVCGPGNNGGDGYALARHAQESGRAVTVVQMPGHAPASELARRARHDYLSIGGGVEEFQGTFPPADVVVDALFGIGLTRPPDPATSALIDAMNRHGAPVLSLDVPSGTDSESGSVLGVAVHADRTLQFVAAHRGLRTGAALDRTGQLSLATLDIPDAVFDTVGAVACLVSAVHLHGWLQPRPRDSHKGGFGHVLCVGGDDGMGGAIALCAEAALRAGAGLVSVATRPSNVVPVSSRRPEAMVHGVELPADVQRALEAASVIAIGPGLGRSPWAQALFSSAVQASRPLVLDADALQLLAESPQTLPDAILTPHPGEAARLLGVATAHVQHDRFAAADSLTKAFNCAIVLKGAGTIVASPGQLPRVIAAGNPGMASGGMGDVLTGVIAGLRAQGLSAFDAACCGALLHALAGDAAAAAGGERGMVASDLFAHLRVLANPGPDASQ